MYKPFDIQNNNHITNFAVDITNTNFVTPTEGGSLMTTLNTIAPANGTMPATALTLLRPENVFVPAVVTSYISNLCQCIHHLLPNADIDFLGLRKALTTTCHEKGKGSVLSKESQAAISSLITETLTQWVAERELVTTTAKVMTKAVELTRQDTQTQVTSMLSRLSSKDKADCMIFIIYYGTGTSQEQRLVIECMLRAIDGGLTKGDTPCKLLMVFDSQDGINFKQSDPNYDLHRQAMLVSAKNRQTYFRLEESPEQQEYDDSAKRKASTSSAFAGERVHFTTVNLPALALEARGNQCKFFDLLKQHVNEACTHLTASSKQLAATSLPIQAEDDDWCNWLTNYSYTTTLSVCFVGLAEALVALTGHHHGDSDQAHKMGLDIMKYMSDIIDKHAQKTGLNFVLSSVPDVEAARRMVEQDRKLYGEVPGVTDQDHYTGSFHIPSSCNLSAYKRIASEAPFYRWCQGCEYTEISMDGDLTKNLLAYERILSSMRKAGVKGGAVRSSLSRRRYSGCL